MEDIVARAPMLGFPELAVGILVLLFLVWLGVTRPLSTPLRFLFLLILLRYVLNFLHVFTIVPIVAGQSINALSTILFMVAGVVALGRKIFQLKYLAIFYIFSVLVIISGMLNMQVMGLANTIIRQILFFSIVVAVFLLPDDDRFNFTVLSKCFVVPLLFQAISLATGQFKATEGDGSVSYIGGYVHEATFSMIPLALMVLTVANREISFRTKLLWCTISLVSIILCNYRTSLLAALPMFAAFLVSSIQVKRQSTTWLIRGGLITAGIAGVTVLFTMNQDRFGELLLIADKISLLDKMPSEFTTPERQFLSGRLQLWAGYLHAAAEGKGLTPFIGFGPDAWRGVFEKYAHNMFISYIYEYGAVGVALTIASMLTMIYYSVNALPKYRIVLTSLHISYLLLTLSTMPNVNIEGVILYGLMCGLTVRYYAQAKELRIRGMSYAV